MDASVELSLAAAWPPEAWRDVSVVVAVSGGADSVALVRAMSAVRPEGAGRLIVAHFNHGLRGADADRDAAFVGQLANQLDLPFAQEKAAERTSLSGEGLEAAARRWRYEFLTRTAEHFGARYVATAHTADDQAETILHHIIRGTGLSGLAGMRRTRRLSDAVTLIRPLLSARRPALLDYLGALGQAFCRDAMNDDVRFTRSRIRHRLLPEIQSQYNRQAVEALVRLGMLAGEAQDVIQPLVAELRERIVHTAAAGEIQIDCSALAKEPRYLVRELLIAVWREQAHPLHAMGFAEWDQMAELALGTFERGESATATFPGNIQVRREGTRLRITHAPAGEQHA